MRPQLRMPSHKSSIWVQQCLVSVGGSSGGGWSCETATLGGDAKLLQHWPSQAALLLRAGVNNIDNLSVGGWVGCGVCWAGGWPQGPADDHETSSAGLCRGRSGFKVPSILPRTADNLHAQESVPDLLPIRAIHRAASFGPTRDTGQQGSTTTWKCSSFRRTSSEGSLVPCQLGCS